MYKVSIKNSIEKVVVVKRRGIIMLNDTITDEVITNVNEFQHIGTLNKYPISDTETNFIFNVN